MVCNLCGQTKMKRIYSFKEHSILKCEQCSLCFLYPQTTPKELKQLYSKDYYFSPDSNVFGYSDYTKDVDAIVLTAIRRFHDIEKLFIAKGKLLDVGCAYGYYLDIARLHGWSGVGAEINEYAFSEGTEHLKLNIKKGTIHDHNFADKSFDVITCWDLIEHLLNPQGFFKEVSRIIKMGGYLIITTPDIDSLPAKIMGRRWMGFKSHEHLYFFNKNILRLYLENNGFLMESCEYIGKYISREIFFSRLKYYFGPLASAVIFLKLFLPSMFYLNPFDILYVKAKKI